MKRLAVLGVCVGMVACEKAETGVPAEASAVSSGAATAKGTQAVSVNAPAPLSPDDAFRASITAAREELPRIAASRRFPYHVENDVAPSVSVAPSSGQVAPPIVQVDGRGVLLDGEKVEVVVAKDDAPSAPSASTAEKARVTISHYGPPLPFPELRKALALRKGNVAGVRIMPEAPADAIRGALDALRREGYRDVYLQTSTDPSKVALVRLIEESSREGVAPAETPEWFLTVGYLEGKAFLSWGLSEKAASRQKTGEAVELAQLGTALCDNWQKRGQHRDADDPVADALVVNMLYATAELVSSVVAAADACKRANGRPAFWVSLRQFTH